MSEAIVRKSLDSADGTRVPGVRFALVLVVIGSVLPITLFAAFLIYFYFEREQARITDAVISRARAMVSVVDREFATIHASLLALATHDSLRRGDIETFRNRATLALAGMKSDSIFVQNGDGQMAMTTRIPVGIVLPRLEKGALLSRIESTRRPAVSDLFIGPIVGTPTISIGVPLFRDETIAGSLNATVHPSQFLDLLAEQRIDPDWRVAIIDSTGHVVARTHDMERYLGKPVAPALLERLRGKQEDAFPTETLDGVRVTTAFSRSSATGWSVAIGIPREEMTEGLYQSLTWLICAALAALAIGLYLAGHTGGRIARSIAALAGPARRIGDGGPVELPPLHFREAVELGSALRSAGASLEQARYDAQHDALTGLPNRVQFRSAVERAIEAGQAHGRLFSVLVIDLDGFKRVNDTFGHDAGDDLLREVARRLATMVRATDLPARLGGDEFAVCLPDTAVEGATRAAEKLIESLSQPYSLTGQESVISASVGVGTYPATADDVDTLIKRTDQAMYQAKARGKNQVVIATRPVRT